MSLKTQLQEALAYCNEALADKGVTDTATSVVDVGDKIATIQTGGSSDIFLIGEFSPSSAVNQFDIAIPNEYQDITAVILDLSGVVLSAGDYIYFRFNEAETGAYSFQSADFRGYMFGMFKYLNGAWTTFGSRSAPSTSAAASATSIGVRCYNSARTFQTSSVIKVYGKR